MTDDIRSFLTTSPVFRDMTPEQLSDIVPLFKSEHHPAGTVILHQGGYSPALYFLRSGRLVARARRGGSVETVAYLQPPAIVGELSVLTGTCCVTNVEVEVDAELLLLPKEVLPKLAMLGETAFWGLLREIAEKMQKTVTLGQKIPLLPTVLLHNHANWEAPFGFAWELTRSLARETGRPTLLANLGAVSPHDLHSLNISGDVCAVAIAGHDERLRAEMAEKLTVWKKRFGNVVLNPVGPQANGIANTLNAFANLRGDLLGPGDPLPGEASGAQFVVQSAMLPTLPVLDGGHQLAFDVAASESAHLAGRPVAPRFQRSADSIARCIAGIQVGVTLGGGVAWGLTHVGVLSVLEEAGVPIDCISGSSMGSIIAAVRSRGTSVAELKELARYMAKHSRSLYEWRFWHMCLFNERTVAKLLRQFLGDGPVNQTEVPFWANAVDIESGREVIIRSGSLVECVRASIALPGGLPPLSRDGCLLVDAVCANPVPVNLVRQMGCGFTIAVNAVPRIEADSGSIRLQGPLSFHKVTHRYPFNFFEVLIRSLLIGAHEIGQAGAQKAADIVLTPALSEFGMVDFSRALEIAESGRRAAQEQLPAILAAYRQMKARSLGRVGEGA